MKSRFFLHFAIAALSLGLIGAAGITSRPRPRPAGFSAMTTTPGSTAAAAARSGATKGITKAPATAA